MVDIGFLCEQIFNYKNHDPFGCGLPDMVVVKQQQRGLATTYQLKCKMCGIVNNLETERKTTNMIPINDAVTLGAISIGIGYSQCEELFANLNVPFMAEGTFSSSFAKVSSTIHSTALTSMEEAAEEERQLAIDLGEVDNEGYPCITVVADGAWSKRSYGINYDAASGVVSIHVVV